MTTTAPPKVTKAAEPAEKPRCWFEVALKPWAQVEADGHPDRIFTSDDERWAGIEKTGKPVRGSLIVGFVKEFEGEFLPKSLRVLHSFQSNWSEALEKMRLFESKGVVWENALAEQMALAEKAREQGQLDMANTIAAAIRESMSAAIKAGTVNS